MNFEYDIWLYLTPLIALLVIGLIVFGLRRRESLLVQFAAQRLLSQLTEKASYKRTLVKAGLILLSIIAICLALARPQYGVEWSERKARGLDIVFVIDTSKSMLATDIRPTRLERAKLAIIDLVERLESDRIGLVAFAGRAFLQTPPTLDYSAFRESLDSINSGIISSGGSDLGNALSEAEKAFPVDNNYKVVVLLTDGEDLGGNAIDVAKKSAANAIKVYAIGIGTPEGDYLRIENELGTEEFVRDSSGQPVRSQLDEATLQKIAELTGGSYSRLSSQSLEALYSSVIATLPREERKAELQETPIERFQWALAAALIFLVLEMLTRSRHTRRVQSIWILSLLLFYAPESSYAQKPSDAEERGEVLDEPPTAGLDDTPESDARKLYNRAYEAQSAGELEPAKQLYQRAISSTNDHELQRDALNNMGHAEYQSGRSAYESGDIDTALQKVVAAEDYFKSALEIDASDQYAEQDLEKVRNVRKAIEEIVKQQQEQQSQDQQQEQEEQQNGDSEQNQDSPQDSQQQEQSEDSENSDSSQQSESEQSGDENQESQNSPESDPNSQNGNNSDSEDTDQGSESENQQSQPENPESASDSEDESTRDPLEDIPEPTSEQDDEEASESENPSASPQSGEAGSDQNADQASSMAGEMAPIEGMTQEDARALLESLREDEQLLPFIDQSGSQNRRDVRDW